MTEKPNVRGSLWHQWDLHVHTPASLIHGYPGSTDDQWEAFFRDIENLPQRFQVLGINDYLFLEGYERVVAARKVGRMTNISLVLPIIELRLNVFGGTGSKFSRVNFHVIFSNELDPAVIQEQFVSGLSRSFQLTPKYQAAQSVCSSWSGLLTRDALTDLGSAIIESVPPDKVKDYGSPIVEGFSNLTVTLEAVQERLKSSFFRDKAITGVGKTEWADVKWQDGSIADKKNVINSADLVFVASESVGAYRKAQMALLEGGVNSRLFDCSDAHNLSTSELKDRIGNCNTWIKADLTFEGLKQAVQEFEHRVFVGVEPAQLVRGREYPSRYVDSIEVHKVESSNLEEVWFDFKLPLNSGLVAVIGNKGSGKSALVEILALLGHSPLEDRFSFLNETKFREPIRKRAGDFRGHLKWLDDHSNKMLLSDSVPSGSRPLLQHLPQQYLESLCNVVPSGEKTEFDQQLERIIFAHLPTEDRLGVETLDAVIDLEGRSLQVDIAGIRNDITKVNARIITIEDALTEGAVRELTEEYRSKRREWWELKKAVPMEVEKPDETDPNRQIMRSRIRELERSREHLHMFEEETRSNLARRRRCQTDLKFLWPELERLEREHKQLLDDHEIVLESLGVSRALSIFNVDWEQLSVCSLIMRIL